MSSKFSLQAFALIGAIAISGLPALASEMTPATPAPGAAIQSDAKAGVSGAGSSASTSVNAKADSKVLPTDKKDSKDLHKDAGKDVKAAKDKVPEQTAKLPGASVPASPVPAPTPTANGTAGTTVQH